MRHKSTGLMGTIKAFVEEYYKNYRHSPSTTQIADAVGIARGTAYKYLVAMNENGMINMMVSRFLLNRPRRFRQSLQVWHYLVLFPAAFLRWRKSI